MRKNEQKYVNFLKEENKRLKNMVVQFIDAVGKLKNIDDVINMTLIPIMTEKSQKFEAEIKAEAVKEFAERLKGHRNGNYIFISTELIDNLLKEMVGENDENL